MSRQRITQTPEYLNGYQCRCGCTWSMHARVIRDDDCPRCGTMTMPRTSTQTQDWETETC